MAADAEKTPPKTPSAAARQTRSRRSKPSIVPAQALDETPDHVIKNKNNKKKKPDPESSVLPVETRTARDRKRRRGSATAAEPADGSAKKAMFERVWSEEDEIKLLRALIHCGKERGVEPAAAVGPATEHLCKELNRPFTRIQVKEKLRRLKRRWSLAAGSMKSACRGANKAHNEAVFELAQEIWDKEPDYEAEAGDAKISSQQPVIAEKAIATVVSRFSDYAHVRSAVKLLEKENAALEPSGIIMRGFRRLLPARAKELDEKWKAHRLEGLKYAIAESKLKNEILQACTEIVERDGL